MKHNPSALPAWASLRAATWARHTSDVQAGPPPIRARLVAFMLRPTTPRLWLGVVVAASLIVVETLLVYLLKRFAPENTCGILYLLGVLVISIGWGFGLAAAMSLASAFAFIYFHMGRGGDFIPNEPQDWAAIVIFMVVALLANGVAQLARSRAVEADQRRREAEASRDELGVLVEQQAALRRVATLVARGVPPSEVFSAVARELAQSLGVCNSALFRYEPDGTGVLLAACDEPGLKKMPVGERFPSEGQNIAALILSTGRAARMDSHENATGPTAAQIRGLGLRGGVGAPIIVNGRLWGGAVVGSSRPEPLPPGTEARVENFADLAATAIANTEARSELTASRARIVAAADDARRRIERDLHDGAQQRLVSLGLELRSAEASLRSELHPVTEQLAGIVSGLTGVGEDLQEMSRGIHPAILSKGGLGPALKTLARRSAVPVELHLCIDRRLTECAEVAAYYVVAEALTNAAKHAQASEVNVSVEADCANLRLSIRDDGIGGADSAKGSGIVGLSDRVEALGGHMDISSPFGGGTSLLATIPLESGPADGL
jgi:signal transduction histidine kinase